MKTKKNYLTTRQILACIAHLEKNQDRYLREEGASVLHQGWTVPLLAEHLTREIGFPVSPSTMAKVILPELGWKTPRAAALQAGPSSREAKTSRMDALEERVSRLERLLDGLTVHNPAEQVDPSAAARELRKLL